MTFDIDIQENELKKRYPTALKALLVDHTTHGNIYWATDSYAELEGGEGYGYDFFDQIQIEAITGDNGNVIRPRAVKSRDEQTKRVKDKAEVFTPSWVCNAQNNLVDEAWFGRPNVFNEEYVDEDGVHRWRPINAPITEFPDGKTWKDYINEIRLEITCGEAPYLVSRYDTTTGEAIPIVDDEETENRHLVFRRIGLLDRKLRLICENVTTPSSWLYYAELAYKSTYGFEWQGDNLLIARENLLLTLKDYYEAMFPNKPINGNTMKSFAYIISWNLWQMDGITFGLPGREVKEKLPQEREEVKLPVQGTLVFDEEIQDENTEIKPEPYEVYCRIMNWKYREWLTKTRSNAKKKKNDINRYNELTKLIEDEDFKQTFALITAKKQESNIK